MHAQHAVAAGGGEAAAAVEPVRRHTASAPSAIALDHIGAAAETAVDDDLGACHAPTAAISGSMSMVPSPDRAGGRRGSTRRSRRRRARPQAWRPRRWRCPSRSAAACSSSSELVELRPVERAFWYFACSTVRTEAA